MPVVEVVLFKEDDGRVPLLEWLNRLKPPKAVVKCQVLIGLLKQFGNDFRRPHADILRSEIREPSARNLGVFDTVCFISSTANSL